MNIIKKSNDKLRTDIIERNIEDSRPIILDLADAGLSIEHLSDLYSLRINYQDFIPILIKWLPKTTNYDVKETIARALSIKGARKFNISKLLINEYKNADPDSSLKWAIANALSVIADEDDAHELIMEIRNETNGSSRQMLVITLGNIHTQEVEDFLIQLLDNENLVGHSVIALGKINSKRSREEIEKLTTHQTSWIRNEAKKAIKKIDKL